MPWFGYIKVNGKIYPVKIPDEWPAENNKPIEVLQKREINKMEVICKLSLLAKKYPYKE